MAKPFAKIERNPKVLRDWNFDIVDDNAAQAKFEGACAAAAKRFLASASLNNAGSQAASEVVDDFLSRCSEGLAVDIFPKRGSFELVIDVLGNHDGAVVKMDVEKVILGEADNLENRDEYLLWVAENLRKMAGRFEALADKDAAERQRMDREAGRI